MVQSDWLLRGPLFHLDTSAEVHYMYLPMAIYVEVIVMMMQCIIKNKIFKAFCSAALQLLSYSCSYQ